ncbi:hypothetical protein ABB37_00797 [Leptomonas pyrrhocoris]|uniref:Uncharacterized protein n=1 Tax=Leptomonas pyrrhocoris TaxID=157538 RepID=A0A0M9GBG1_LEPPY|nr:hypothetical protein ABB37_00797 [Leptomonas pyrrhocoris]KPA86706.1 hypothetical protein ABB37_00797 [Leptomonas pyrrhocoris]|eukprot:XP_015665145.1 hypothetical protein ABB37_00797 [Leptomonas pyrrhocoris]
MKGIMQYAPCCDAVSALSDSEVRSSKPRLFSAAFSHLDTAQLPKVLQLRPSSSLTGNAPLCCGSESGPTLPTLLPHRESRRFLALIDLFVNNEKIQLNLESCRLPCAYEVQILPDLIDRQARRYNDQTELRFSLHVRHCSIKARNLYLSLRFPWGTTHYLGPLAQQTVVSSARFVSDLPTSVTLVLDVDHCIPEELDAPLPCEMLLKEHVKTILENDDFCGSIAAAHVQNLVRDFPFYAAAMRRFRNWSEYVILFADFYGCWGTVQYEEEEHATLGLSSLTPPGELRLVANSFASRYARSDVHRDKIKWRALCDFRDQVLEGSADVCKAVCTSRKGETTLRLSRNFMRALSNEGSFRTLNSVNYLHVLESLMESRFVLFNELHPIQVDSCMLPNTSEELLLTVGSR